MLLIEASQMADTKEIETFAFLDLETSGLPMYNFGKTCIIELSLIACSKEIIKNPPKSEKLPRLLHKLTLCFNPAARIPPGSTKFSGLDNFMLENEHKFDENAGNIIKSFIQHLQKPVCLVAHNGDRYDYPIMKKHMQNVGVNLPDEILCIDSLPACKKMDQVLNIFHSMSGSEIKNNVEHVMEPRSGGQRAEDVEILQKPLHDENMNNEGTTKNEVDRQKLNETTPKRPILQNLAIKRNISGVDENDSGSTERISKSCRQLFPTNSSKTDPSYKLGSIYKRVLKETPENLHHAEGDVVTLLKIAMFYGEEFLTYAKCNAVPFSDIPALGSK